MTNAKTAAERIAEIHNQEQALEALRKKRDDLRAEMPRAERAGVDAITELEESIARVELEERHAERALSDSRNTHEALATREAEDRRREDYIAASKLRKEKIDAAIATFAKVSKMIDVAYTGLEEATAAVDLANVNRPDGADRLLAPHEDDRLVAGAVYESVNGFVQKTVIDWRDARFWARFGDQKLLRQTMEPPFRKPAHSSFSKELTGTSAAAATHAGRGLAMPVFHTPQLAKEPRQPDDTTFEPVAFVSVRG